MVGFLVLSTGNHHCCHSDHDFYDYDLYYDCDFHDLKDDCDDHDLKDDHDDHDTCSLQRSCRMLVRHDGVLCLKLGGLKIMIMKILLMMISEHHYDGQ